MPPWITSNVTPPEREQNKPHAHTSHTHHFVAHVLPLLRLLLLLLLLEVLLLAVVGGRVMILGFVTCDGLSGRGHGGYNDKGQGPGHLAQRVANVVNRLSFQLESVDL